MNDPLLTKRHKRAPIGWLIGGALCLDCDLPAANRQITFDELREGDDGGKPYRCFRCGKELKVADG